MKTIKKQARVMHMAHYLYNGLNVIWHCPGIMRFGMNSWQECVNKAWRLEKVREQMQRGVVWLYYTKQNGDTNSRHGTLCPEYIPMSAAPKSADSQELHAESKENWSTIAYYDMTVKGWRSFNIANLLKAVRTVIFTRTTYSDCNRIY